MISSTPAVSESDVTDARVEDGHAAAIPDELPILPLKGAVLFPSLMLPFIVGRLSSVQMVDEALRGDKLIAFVAQRDPEVQDPKPDQLHSIGTAGVSEKMFKMPDDSLRIVVRGLARVSLDEITSSDPYFRGRVSVLSDREDQEDISIDAMSAQIKTNFNKITELSSQIPSDLAIMALNISEPGLLADLVGSSLNIELDKKQELLETLSVAQRLQKVLGLVAKEEQLL